MSSERPPNYGPAHPLGQDCDDNNASVNPSVPKSAEMRLDNNCDGQVDNYSGPLAERWYRDMDGDGFGDRFDFVDECLQPSGYVANFADCDDSNATISPAADERCDGVDNDCNFVIDEASAIDAVFWVCRSRQ